MTIEVEPGRERLGPRIIKTEETGRLELSVRLLPQANLPSPSDTRSRLPVAAAATGVGILVVAVLGIELVQFIDGAFAHGTALGFIAPSGRTTRAHRGRCGAARGLKDIGRRPGRATYRAQRSLRLSRSLV